MKPARADLGVARTWLPAQSLPPRAAARAAVCGAPIVIHGTIPDVIENAGVVQWNTKAMRAGATWRCGLRYCESCSRDRAKRIFAATKRLVDAGAAAPVMVTLTVRARRKTSDIDCYRSALNDLRAAWRSAIMLIHHQARGLLAVRASTRERWRQAIPPPYRVRASVTAAKYEKYCSTWDALEAWKGATQNWVCVVEIEQNAQYIHAHMHVVCDGRATAERLNAAWQHTRPTRAMRQSQVGTTINDAVPTSIDAARYAAKYVTKPVDAKHITGRQAAAMVAGLHRRRMVAGSGAWRSLRLMRPPSQFDIIEAVETSDRRVHRWADWVKTPESRLQAALQAAHNDTAQPCLRITDNERASAAPVPLLWGRAEAKETVAQRLAAARSAVLEQVTNNVPTYGFGGIEHAKAYETDAGRSAGSDASCASGRSDVDAAPRACRVRNFTLDPLPIPQSGSGNATAASAIRISTSDG